MLTHLVKFILNDVIPRTLSLTLIRVLSLWLSIVIDCMAVIYNDFNSII
ncbi:hypothetical protein RCH13_002803 [Chryseobacterium sp. MP_3.2]|nr:hypothetical protein [Chryseobacterium sp. MP_3.2]